MNAKEKANELFNKMDMIIYTDQDNWKSQCIRCALIAVDEIIATEPRYPSNVDWDDVGATHQYFYEAQREEALEFWNDVKSELQSL
jgi:hypothetical protein